MVRIQSAQASSLDQPLTDQGPSFASAYDASAASAGVWYLGHPRGVMPNYLAPGSPGVVALNRPGLKHPGMAVVGCLGLRESRSGALCSPTWVRLDWATPAFL
jgi:hypothetical protein